ncbi:hypothetical protein BJ165DRAFT_1400381 [Panaeolus papilionaceus]|nr:hypothetical protein BJ165DRAFT_1400381 [Panaeolus papilionaceus]
MKPATNVPSNLASPIPIAHTRSAPSLLTPSPVVSRFYGLGTDESRKQDEDDDALILQIRSKPLNWQHASQVVGGFNTRPILPDSVISKIFNLSMHVPGAVDVDNTEDIHHFTQLHIWAAGHPAFAVYRHTGYSLMQLSKHWYLATRKSRFRYIRIRSSKRLASFVKLLREGLRDEESLAPGEWVQRLDLNVNSSWAWRMEDSQMLNDVFTLCLNLTCFSTIGSTTRPTKFGLPALVAKICCIAPRLRRLELAADHHVLQALHDSQIDRVEVLWVVSATGDMIGNNVMNSSFPSVRTLIAGSDTEIWLRHLRLPSSRGLLMDNCQLEDMPDVDRRRLEYISMADSWDLTQLDDFTGLKGISIKYSEICHRSIKWPKSISESEVESITIYDMRAGWSSVESHANLKPNFDSMIAPENFPVLKRVRLLIDVDNEGQPRLPHAMKGVWRNWVAISKNVNSIAIEVLPAGRCANQHPIEPNDLYY